MKQIPFLAKLNMFGVNEASQFFVTPMIEIAVVLVACQYEFQSNKEAVILDTDVVLNIVKPTILGTYDDVLECRDENSVLFKLLPERNMFLTRDGVVRLSMLLEQSSVADIIEKEIQNIALGGRTH